MPKSFKNHHLFSFPDFPGALVLVCVPLSFWVGEVRLQMYANVISQGQV